MTLTDLSIEGCLYDVSGASESIVDVEECTSGRARGTIRLHRIGFRDNRLNGAVAVKADTTSCSVVEIKDFDFCTNTCNGVCGLLLAKENRLRSIAIEQNQPIPSSNSGSVIVRVPPKSVATVDRIRAFANSCPIFEIEGGSFSLSNGNFTKNAETVVKDIFISACINLKDASASIQDSTFEENRADYGAAINAHGSNVTLKDCAFRSNVAEIKGTVLLRNGSSLTTDSSLFSSNRAEKSGGAIDAQKTELSFRRLTCIQNKAGLTGGCLHANVLSSVTMSSTTLEGNRAPSGGALFFKRSSAVITNSHLLSNSASKYGGGIRSKESHIFIRELIADRNYADFKGGSISISSDTNLTVHDSVFNNSAGRNGGAVEQSANSVGRFVNVAFENNNGYDSGGSVSVNNATLIVRNSRFRDGGAGIPFDSGSGGFVFAYNDSSVLVESSTMTNGVSVLGGAIQLESATFKAKGLNVSHCSASFYGGAVNIGNTALLDDTPSFSSEAVDVGSSGFLCIDCLFVSNEATFGGGVVSVADGRGRTVAVQLEGNRILNNTAASGGDSAEIVY